MSRFRRMLCILPFRKYLESTGRQYIVTNLTVTKSTGTLEINFSPTEVKEAKGSSGSDYNGVVGKNSAPQIGWCNNGWTIGNAVSTEPYMPEVGTIYTAAWGYGTNEHLYIDGQDTTLSRSGNFSVIICSVADTPTNAKAKVYYCKITDTNGKITHYFVPCTYGGLTGMYDTVDKVFYENQGTGDFIMGNIIELAQ